MFSDQRECEKEFVRLRGELDEIRRLLGEQLGPEEEPRVGVARVVAKLHRWMEAEKRSEAALAEERRERLAQINDLSTRLLRVRRLLKAMGEVADV